MSPFSNLALITKKAHEFYKTLPAKRARFFLIRALRAPKAMAAWIMFLDARGVSAGLATVHYDFYAKPLRSYGFHGLTVAQRAAVLQEHYHAADQHIKPAILRALLAEEEIPLVDLQGKKKTYQLLLTRGALTRREGEMTFELRDLAENLRLATMTVFLLRAGAAEKSEMKKSNHAGAENAPLSLFIGGLQGAPPNTDKKLIINATRDLSGMRPKVAVFEAGKALAQLCFCQNLYAVSNDTHIVNGKWEPFETKIKADYNGFWQEQGGELQGGELQGGEINKAGTRRYGFQFPDGWQQCESVQEGMLADKLRRVGFKQAIWQGVKALGI